jgi:N-hydroxyarylamine O-acetyltransferase
VLDEDALFDKVVARRRGGFCYELNGLFAALLRALGFSVDLLNARVANAQGEFGPPFDHLALRVALPGGDRLADVGFGDSFREPLRLDERDAQHDEIRAYRVTPGVCILSASCPHPRRGPQGAEGGEPEWQMEARQDDGAWRAEYRFAPQPRALGDFAAMCDFHQSSPESTFTRRRVCSRATPAGRVTLSNDLLIVTENGARHERALQEAEVPGVLRELFGVTL